MIPIRDSQPSRSTPYVTILIIVLNSVIFLYERSLESYSLNYFVAEYALIPAQFHPSALITCMFLHGGWMHLIGNMWFLWIFGDNIEDILGHGKYVLFYLLCGIAAGLLQMITSFGSQIPTVGASGAIAGVMGAYMVKFPHSRIVTLLPIFIFFTTIEIPAVLMLIYWFAIQVFSGFGEIGRGLDQGGVAWFAHVGGFAAGIILIYTLRTNERYRYRRDLHW